MKPNGALVETALESNVKTKVIAFGVFSFIFVVVGIGYCLCNPKSEYYRKRHHSAMDSRNYNFMDQICFDPDGNEIPKILLSSHPPFLSRQETVKEVRV